MTLPVGWVWTSMEELIGDEAPIVYGIIQAGPEVPGGVPYIRPTELVDGRIDISALKRTSPSIASRYSRSVLREGDIVLAIVGTIGKLAIVPPELDGANITQSSARLRPPRFMPAPYLAAALRSRQLRGQFEKMEFGVAVRRLNIAHVRALRIPIAPANEQRRIVAKLDAIFEKTRAARARLERLPALLEKLKRSILAAAFRGDLTADWRAAHPDVETASVLLDRIRAERRRRWESELQAKGKDPTKATYDEPVPINSEGIPRGWLSMRLDDLVDPVRGIPYGIVQTGEHTAGGVPTVRCGDIKNFTISAATLKAVDPRIASEYSRTLLQGGELLIAIRGTTGGVALAAPELAGANLSREVAMIPVLSFLVPEFYKYAIAAPQAQRAIAGQVKGVAQQGINLEDLRNLALPVPPVAEQRAIAAVVATALERLGGNIAGINSSAALALTLEQAALAKAFRGELVPQDPTDEPASVLLERLRAARAAEPDRPRRGRAAAPRAPAATLATSATTDAEPLDLVIATFQQGESRLAASAIAATTGLPPADVEQALATLVAAGQVRVHGKARATSYEWLA